LQGPDERLWLDRIYLEVDNIRAALTWATGCDEGTLAMSLLGHFGFWTLQGRRIGYLLGPWAAAVLATKGARDDPRFTQVLALRALDHYHHQRIDDAERDADQALDLLADPATEYSPDPWSVLCLTLIYAGRADEVTGVDMFLDAARATADDYVIASALGVVALWWYVLDRTDRGLILAEEAFRLARRIGNPTLTALAGLTLGGALDTTDPARARSTLETALEYAKSVDHGQFAATCLAWLGRMGAIVATPQWASQFREGLDPAYEAGDTRMVLQFLDIYSQSLVDTDRAESAAILAAAVAELSSHVRNPISVAHRRIINERLLTALGAGRFTELTAHGATLDYDDAVDFARAELDRVIANDNQQ
jgi:hypothetical protein